MSSDSGSNDRRNNHRTSAAGSNDRRDDQSRERPPLRPPASLKVKNRRKRYLDKHPEYFSADLEMAGPLLPPETRMKLSSHREREADLQRWFQTRSSTTD